jgi:fatty acid desaturase
MACGLPADVPYQSDAANVLQQRGDEMKAKTGAISWPALGLFLLGPAIISFASGMAITDGIPLWSGMLANGLGLYLLFSIMHDALHRNVSINR